MKLSVIVCTYNRCQLLAGNLVALAKQVTAAALNWEVVVVDNNCVDDTAAVVREAAKFFPVGLRRVTEQKQGLSNARNRGITEAQGRYLAFTDDDTRPAADWVANLWWNFLEGTCDAVAG